MRAGIRQKTPLWNTQQMESALSQARSPQMKQHSRTAPERSGQRAPSQKTDSKGATDETEVTLCLALQERVALRFTDRSSLPHMNVLSTNTVRGKKGRAQTDKACALVHVVLLITQEFVLAQLNL